MAAGVEYVLIISEVGRLRKEFQESGDIYIKICLEKETHTHTRLGDYENL